MEEAKFFGYPVHMILESMIPDGCDSRTYDSMILMRAECMKGVRWATAKINTKQCSCKY